MTTTEALYVQFINFMGDEDDYEETNLIGPFTGPRAQAYTLARLANLPLGRPEYNGGYQFLTWNRPSPPAARVVPPAVVASATTIRAFFTAFFDFPDGAEDTTQIHPDQTTLTLDPGQ